ncbi:zinc finger protein 69-like isoform X2 [Bacillus rossius redtenbacheri]|uniref:zinc finger protein 69-like isoform X2 n=1 Tax=Bacillus rossius redtenbacheri TaxID=93214 RepID=UPI002FDD0D83
MMATEVCVKEEPVMPELCDIVLPVIKEEIKISTESVCVKEEPVELEPFEQVFQKINEGEDDAAKEWMAAYTYTGTELVPAEEEAWCHAVMKEEVACTDVLACSQGAAATCTGFAKSNELLYAKEESHKDGMEAEQAVCKDDLQVTSHQGYSLRSCHLDTIELKKHQGTKKVVKKKKLPSVLVTRANGSDTRKKSISCSLCNTIFIKKVHLNAHMIKHTDYKPFSCSLCSGKFREKRYLKRHLKIHTDNKLFSCSLCSGKFREKIYLKRHLLIHSDNKPFSCSLCSFKYKRKTLLNRHLRAHTDEKPFSCSLCSLKYRDKSSLTRHMRIHTDNKPFLCLL